MADAELFCAKCDAGTDHTYMSRYLYICAVCGKERNGPFIAERKGTGHPIDLEVDIKNTDKPKRGIGVMRKQLSEAEKDQVRERDAAGESAAAIAIDYGIKPNAVWYYCKGPGASVSMERADKKGADKKGAAGKKGKKAKPVRLSGALSGTQAVEGTGRTFKAELVAIIDQRILHHLADWRGDMDAEVAAAVKKLLK